MDISRNVVHLAATGTNADDLAPVLGELITHLEEIVTPEREQVHLHVAVGKTGTLWDERQFFTAAVSWGPLLGTVAEFVGKLSALNRIRQEAVPTDEEWEFGARAAIALVQEEPSYLPVYADFLSSVDLDHAHAHVEAVELLAHRHGEVKVAQALAAVLADSALFVDALPWLAVTDLNVSRILLALERGGADSVAEALAGLRALNCEGCSAEELEALCGAAKRAIEATTDVSIRSLYEFLEFAGQPGDFFRESSYLYLAPALDALSVRDRNHLFIQLDRGLLRHHKLGEALLLTLERAHARGAPLEEIEALRGKAHEVDGRPPEELLAHEANRVLRDTIQNDAVLADALPSLAALLDTCGHLVQSDGFFVARIVRGFMALFRRSDPVAIALGLRIAAHLSYAGDGRTPPSYMAPKPAHFFDFLLDQQGATAIELAARLHSHLAAQEADEGWSLEALKQAAALLA